MPKYNTQKIILQNFDNRSLYPYINRSDMMLVRWLIAKSPADFQELTEEQVRKSLYNIRKQKYIKSVPEKSDKENEINFRIELTKKGKNILKTHQLKDLVISYPKTWDNKWRFVIFDIPEKHRYARDTLRDKLKKLNFFQIQKSVWVHPYECEKEIDFLLEYFGVTEYVLNFTTLVEKDYLLKKYFRENGFKL